MSIESKAKTAKEIIEYNQTFISKDNKKADAEQKWVPFEEAQKEIEELKKIIDDLVERTGTLPFIEVSPGMYTLPKWYYDKIGDGIKIGEFKK